VQAISDELRASEAKLEARLDALVNDQATLWHDTQGAWLAIKQAGGSDPLAQQGTLTHLADRERGIVAEAGTIADIAADEIDAIGKKAEDQRSDEEKVRVVQLKNLDLYLLDGRTRISEARRKLQELAAEEALGKAEAALVDLKRAREQLLDPITVMRGVTQEELELHADTTRAAAGSVVPDPKAPEAATPPPPEQVPAWLAPTAMSERQGSLRDRLEEVRARLAAATEAKPPTDKPADPKQVKLLERVKAALPFVGEASTAMDRAREALAGKQTKTAVEQEEAALVALVKAIEQFSDLKQTIELAYGDQERLVKLLSPEAAQLPAAERAKATHDALAANLARMPRIKELIADELAALKEPPADPKADPKQVEAAKQQLEQDKQRYARAEQLRGEAATALDQLDKAITAAKDPVPPAKDAHAKLDELRKLFFNVIEHLQQLIRDQSETRDQTTTAAPEDEFARQPKYPTLIGRQEQHGAMAKAITDALAAQADAAGKAQQPQQGAPDPKTLAAAADEVRQAQGDMGDAKTTLTKAKEATKASESLDPALKSQAKAIEHLEAALRLLQPPKQDKDKDQKQDQQDQQQQQQQQQAKKDKDKDEQQKAAGPRQQAKDDDARRQRERRKQESQSDPVDQDW